MGNILVPGCVRDFITHVHTRGCFLTNNCTWHVLLWGKTCHVLLLLDFSSTKYSAVKHCPSPFSDHFSIIPHPTYSLPTSRSFPSSIHCQEGQPPKSHFNSARHRQRLVDPAASKVSVSVALGGRCAWMAMQSLCESGDVGLYLCW